MKKCMIFLMVLCLLLTAGCTDQNVADVPTDSTEQTESAVIQPDEEMFTRRDKKIQYNRETCVRIELCGDTATATSDTVRIDGNSITIIGEETYYISGTLDNGSMIVEAGETAKPQLVLDGVTITSTTAALEIKSADKVFVTLAEGSENRLSSSESGAAILSDQDLTFNGGGSLTISSVSGHGIACKDDLVFTGGSYNIQSASHGLDVNDSVRITGNTTLHLNSGKDGIHCENQDNTTKGFVYIEAGNVKIASEGDGISAGAYARILDGNIDIVAGGGSVNGSKEQSDFFGDFMGGGMAPRPRQAQSAATEDSTSMKGLKAVGQILIAGGSYVMDTADDCIHSNSTVTVSGGSFELSSGDDGFHADETLTVSGGSVNIKTSYEGLEAHKIYVQGGEVQIHAKDDGINAASGQDASGTEGGRDGMFGAPADRPMNGQRPGGPMGGGRPAGPMGGGSSDGVIDISGGQLRIYASGDGMDANGSITISNGDLYVTNPTSGDTSVLDSDNGAVITGGRFLSAGASTMMAQSFRENSTQGVIACTVGRQTAKTPISVQDASGKVLVSYETEYDCVLVIISTPELKKGETYTLTVGENSGPVQAT